MVSSRKGKSRFGDGGCGDDAITTLYDDAIAMLCKNRRARSISTTNRDVAQ